MLNILEFLNNQTEHHRASIELGFNDFLQHFFQNNSFIAHLFISSFIFILYNWTLGFLNLIQTLLHFELFKIQPIAKSQKITTEAVCQLVPVVLLNQILSILEAGAFFLIQNHLWPRSEHIPSLTDFLCHLFIFLLTGEVIFYYTHRLHHLRPIYKRIHYIHHKWKTPFGLTTDYCHPIEHLTANMLPIFLPPTLLQSHLLVHWTWYTIVTSASFYVHCGYALPVVGGISRLHDLHHQKIKGNFGTNGLLDWLHGTRLTAKPSSPHRPIPG